MQEFESTKLIKETLEGQTTASNDIGDITWNVPTGVLNFPASAPGVLYHHWKAAVTPTTKETKYFSLLPTDAKPPLDLNLEMMEKFRSDMRKFLSEQAAPASLSRRSQSAQPNLRRPPEHHS